MVGNYWDNHTSPDADNDGIVDIPYSWIAGTAASIDNFPLTENPIFLGEKIHIDDSGVSAWNWSKTARCKVWCTGMGTYSNPYIIEGLEIDAGGSGSCVLIENSNTYFIIRNCKVYNARYQHYDAGIKLYNTNNGTLTYNNCSNNEGSGIFLYNNCDNNSISENIANNNSEGFSLWEDCDDNTISGNTANNNSEGISVQFYSDDNTISGNEANNNRDYGIGVFYYSDDNIVSGNTINSNDWGIFTYGLCHNNTISGNVAFNNTIGITLSAGNDNIISGNIANNNLDYGISIDSYCNYNTISGNIVTNSQYGIYLEISNDNNISENTLSDNSAGIYLYDSCNNNNISENKLNDNNDYGIYLESFCDDNTILGNTVTNNSFGVYFYSDDCYNNLIYFNEFIENGVNAFDNGYNYWDNGTIGNYWDDYTGVDEDGDGIGDTPYFVPTGGVGHGIDFYPIWDIPYLKLLFVEISDQSFSTEEFNITLSVYNESGHGIIFASIQMWWNGNYVSSEIQNLGNGYYFISLEQITVASGEDPILLNMTVSASGYENRYFETNISIHPTEILKLLQVEISDHSYSLKHFNFTFFILDETEQGVDSAIIQMWWNGIEVTNDIQNLGNGYYFISLEPMTVESGEDPILLNMTISATGYEDKYFETYIAVEPPEIEKALRLEITETFYSIEHFNLTFFICDETDLGIDSASIQMWWNGIDVTADVINLGNGLYFVSLEPITVASGEDPILLNMIISADGYEDKHFETYLAVDPDTLSKNGGTIPEEFPLAIIIISTLGGIGVAGVSLYLLHRRKRTKNTN
jgi:parallel beta-helix repeat protein